MSAEVIPLPARVSVGPIARVGERCHRQLHAVLATGPLLNGAASENGLSDREA